MQIQMGVVGQPNITITAYADEQDMRTIEDMNAKRQKQRPVERDAFDMARRRFASQGAEQVRYFVA